MNCKYTIKNFRVFDDKGATFNLRPITVLTGCNNSGKSSLVKSLLVFIDYVKRVGEESLKDSIRLQSQKIRFNLSDINLGFFDNVINDNHKNNIISFEISIYSHILFEELSLFMSFGYGEYDKNRDLELLRLILKNKENTILYEFTENENHTDDEYINFNYLIPKCIASLLAEFEDGKKRLQQELSQQEFVDLVSSINKNQRQSINYSQDMLLQMHDKRIFYYLPIYNEVFGMEKSDCINFIKSLMTIKHMNNSLIEIVLDDFSISKYNSLEDYIRTWERDYFDNLSNHEEVLLGTIDSGVFTDPVYSFYLKDRKQHKYQMIYVAFAFLTDYNNTDNEKNNVFEIKYESEGVAFFDGKCLDSLDDRCFDNLFDIKSLFCEWYNRIFPEIFHREIPCSLAYFDPTNIIQKKVYSIDAKDTMAEILNTYINLPEHTRHYGKTPRIKGIFVNKWVEKLGLGKYVSISKDEEGVGVYIKLHKSNEDKGTLLVYNGSGVFQLVFLLIRIEIAMFSANERGIYWRRILKEDNNETIPYKINNNTISLVEPEAHLHPSIQAKIADIIIDAHNTYDIDFIIETHSEYLIRKLQALVAQNQLDNNDAIIYYMYDPKQDDIPEYVDKVKEIRINEDGSLTDSFGSGFFDESYNLSNELLKVKLGLI